MILTEKKYTYISQEHSDRASNKAFFCVWKLDCKISGMLLVSKIVNVVRDDDDEKKERNFEVAVGTKDELWIQAVDL